MSPQPNPPRLSIAIPAYNAQAFLADTLDSVLAQDFADFELLVLDDGSTDRTRAIAEGYAARDPRIRVISRENRGIPASLQELFLAARAPLVARLDADDLCEPGRLAQQVAFLHAHPDYGIVGSQVYEIDEQGRRTPGPAVPCAPEAIVAALPRYSPFYHPAVMVRRELVLAVGGYRALYRYGEDYDLWLRLSRVTRMANLPERLLAYRVHSGQSTSRNRIAYARQAAFAWLAHCERVAGRSDPTADLVAFPPDEAVDGLFGAGALDTLRRRVFRDVVSSRAVREGEAWPLALECAHGLRDHFAIGRIAWRHLRARRPRVALRILAALAGKAFAQSR